MKYGHRMVLGYLVGGFLVIFMIPSIIFLLTTMMDICFRIEIIQNIVLRWIAGAVSLMIGLLFGLSSIIYQNVIGKGGPLEISNIEISPKTKYLVETGPYRYTRNPMLLGTILIYLAFAIFINSITAVFLVMLFAAFMLTFVVRKEEKRLLKDFGKQYEQYRNKTSMIIPWPPKKVI